MASTGSSWDTPICRRAPSDENGIAVATERTFDLSQRTRPAVTVHDRIAGFRRLLVQIRIEAVFDVGDELQVRSVRLDSLEGDGVARGERDIVTGRLPRRALVQQKRGGYVDCCQPSRPPARRSFRRAVCR